MDSTVGLAIQSVGIFLVTLLSFFTRRSLQTASSKYWAGGWSCLSISLASLFAAFYTSGAAQHFFYSLYFLGEYGFGLMFIAGCRSHVLSPRVTQQRPVIIGFVVLAAVLPWVSKDFNNLFIVQAAIMSVMFAAAFIALRPARQGIVSPGVRVMSAALLLLALDFLHYILVFGSHQADWGLPVPEGYFNYTSIFDLILEILL